MLEFIYFLAAASSTGNDPHTHAQFSPPPTNPIVPTPPRRPAYVPPQPSQNKRPAFPVPRGNPGNWIQPAIDYPPAARAARRQGTTAFELTVDRNGRVVQCKIVSSSGWADLDHATCVNVTRRARFLPAFDASGNPTTGKYSNRSRWQL